MLKSHSNKLLVLLICIPTVFVLSLSCCDAVHCETEDGMYLTVRLMRDGKNMVFGSDSLVSRDQVKHFTLADGNPQRLINFDNEHQAVVFFTSGKVSSVIQLASLTSDTFNVTTQIISMDECCTEYEITSVLYNGDVICTIGCDQIIEIEI